MQQKDSMFPIVDSHGRLECKELWGGIRNQNIEVSAGKVIGSIFSSPCGEGGKGGDIYYFGVCKGDAISRLAIADVTGHGGAVSEISQYVYNALKAHMWAPDKDVLDANAEASLSELKSAVLKTLNQYAQKELTHDDVTLIALEIR